MKLIGKKKIFKINSILNLLSNLGKINFVILFVKKIDDNNNIKFINIMK